MLNLNTLVALLTVIIRISLAEAFDNCKISVEQINTMVHTYQLLAGGPKGEHIHTNWTGRGGNVSSTTYDA